jgi:hypothetical protein
MTPIIITVAGPRGEACINLTDFRHQVEVRGDGAVILRMTPGSLKGLAAHLQIAWQYAEGFPGGTLGLEGDREP